jgi:hypothetical protein
MSVHGGDVACTTVCGAAAARLHRGLSSRTSAPRAYKAGLIYVHEPAMPSKVRKYTAAK